MLHKESSTHKLGRRRSCATFSVYALLRQLGSGPIRAIPSTARTDVGLGRPIPRIARLVPSAVQSTNQPEIRNEATVPESVATRGTILRVSKRKHKHPVYNLTVDRHHCYFANGILTHNCDALAWLGNMLMDYGIVNQKVVKVKSFRDKLQKMTRGGRQKSAMVS